MDCNCKRCGHGWVSRLLRRPVVCPRCKSYDWDKPRKPEPDQPVESRIKERAEIIHDLGITQEMVASDPKTVGKIIDYIESERTIEPFEDT